MIDLGKYTRYQLGHFPTALEFMPNLTKHLDGPNIYVKRDDCTGLATGGNKTRKLEFLLAAAISARSDVLITSGALQSNHVRQTIAAAARAGIACKVVLQQRQAAPPDEYLHSGNVLLNDLMDGEVAIRLAAGTDMEEALGALARDLQAAGRKPFVIPGGGSIPQGVLGYVACAQELLEQSARMGFPIEHVVHATGSGGTQAGLIIGLRAGGSEATVHGISVGAVSHEQEQRVLRVVQQTLDYTRLPQQLVDRASIKASSDYVGEGYGLPTAGMIEAVRLVARLEGLLLDPVYSGKAMAGLIDLVRKKRFKRGENVVFIHTGGTVGLFAYRDIFRKAAPERAAG